MAFHKLSKNRRRPKKRVVLGLDFGATLLKSLLLDAEGHIYGRFSGRSEVSRGPEVTMKNIAGLISRAQDSARNAGLELKEVGIGVCAPLGNARDTIIQSPVLPGWNNVPVKSILSRQIGMPIHLENDASLAILGEWWKGAAMDCAIAAGVTLGTGIGGGLVINGSIYRGASGFGAEFGHIRVASGPRCSCGGRGCLGAVASATATISRYKKISGRGAEQIESIRDLCRLLARGDLAAEQAVLISARHLAEASLILINALNPDVIILAGGMSVLADRLVNPIASYIHSAGMRGLPQNTRIAAAALGAYSGCFGAGYMALNHIQYLPRNR
ncbi:MAG: ROK family protein [Acidobacteria bacterium]|nr:ROK family protein [Acidobacteriota bacterium]